MTEVEKAVEAAQAEVEEKQRVLAGVQERLAKERAGVETIDEKVGALPLDNLDVRVLLKLDGERTTRRVMAELLERGHLPKARAAVEQAQVALARAQKAVEAVRAEEALAAFHTSAARATEVAVAAIAELRPLLAEHAAAAAEAAAHGFSVGEGTALLKAHHLLGARDYGQALQEIGRLVLAAELATAEPSPLAVQERRREQERRDAHLAKLMADRAATEAATARRRAAGGGGVLVPSGESWNDERHL